MDSAFDENTRYFIYDDKNQLVTFATNPSFHVDKPGRYTIKILDPVGNKISDDKEISIVASSRWNYE